MLSICTRQCNIGAGMVQEMLRPVRECNRRELHSEELCDLFCSFNIKVGIRLIGHVAWIKERDLKGEVERQYCGSRGGDVDWIVISVMDSVRGVGVGMWIGLW